MIAGCGGGGHGGAGSGGRGGSGGAGISGAGGGATGGNGGTNGGTSGSGGASGGGTGGSGPPTDGRSFCTTFEQKTCQLAFDCIPAPHSTGFITMFGNTLAECQGAKAAADCASTTCVPRYDATAGADCIATYAAFTCDDFPSTPPPASCNVACPTSGAGGSSGAGGAGGAGGMAGASGGRGGSGPAGSGGASGSGGTSGAGGRGGASGAGGGGGTAGASGGRGGASGGTAGVGGAGGAGGGTLGPNLVVNGDFSNGETNWSFTVQAGVDPGHGVNAGQLCVGFDVSQTVTIRWPTSISTAFAIRNGIRYQFSYSVLGLGNVASFEAKVGQAAAPYTATDFLASETLGQTLQPYTHTFTATADDLQAGVTFTLVSSPSGGTGAVCMDDVAARAFQ